MIPVIFLLLAILGVVGYFVVSKYLSFDGIEEVNTEEVVQADYPITEAYDKLGDVNLSLRDIQQIEKNVIHNGNATDEDDLNRRLMALKHLYTNEFMRDTHTVQNLRNIYLLYSTDFSVSQQNIMKWFLELPPSQQEQWEYVHGGVQSFQDFRQRVEAEIAGHSR